MFRRNLAGVIIAASLILIGAPGLRAQATFGVSSGSSVTTAIGATELAGNVTISIVSGQSVAAPFVIQYSGMITNNSASDIEVRGSGFLVGVQLTPILDLASNSLTFTVPTGGQPGNSITVAGVRIALAGKSYTTVTATISSPLTTGNAILAGQSTCTVISNAIKQPFAVDETSSAHLQWRNGEILTGTTTILISEKYATAFSSAVGTYGQTVPTRFRIKPFQTIPPGVKFTFAPVAASLETNSTLAIMDSVGTIPRDDGSTDINFAFNAAAGSSTNIETFPITVTVALDDDSTSSGTNAFLVTLEPVGIATPDTNFPSTDIPRYSELTLPAETDLVTGSAELAFPYRPQSAATYTGIAMTNPQEFPVSVTLTAYDATGTVVSGTGVTNPATLTIPAFAQTAQLATQIFGPNFNAASGGTIRVLGKTSILPGFYLIGDTFGTRLDGATADLPAALSWTWPAIFHQAPLPSTTLELFNPGTAIANVTLRLLNASGTQLSNVALQVPPNGTVASQVTDIFAGLDLGSFTGGYIAGRSDVQLVVRETFGNAQDNNVLFAQSGFQRSTIPIAHFASGGGYSTELNITNIDASAPAQITFTALDNNGTALAITGNPKTITVQPGKQFLQTMKELFPSLPATLTTGHIRMEIAPYFLGPFQTTPLVLGYIRFSSGDGYASASLPLFIPTATEFIYAHIAQNLGYYTGVALLNTGTSAATVNVEARDKGGVLIGNYSTILQPGQKIAKLVYEMVPNTLGQIGGYVRVRSNHPICSFALFGTNDGKSLSAIPLQPIE